MNRFYEFATFRIEPEKRLLWKKDEAVRLKPKTFDTLLFLLESRHKVVTKDEMIGEIWNGTAVSDDSLTQQISQIRKVLNDSEHQFIATVSGVGYQFIADVREINSSDGDALTDVQANGDLPAALEINFEKTNKTSRSSAADNQTIEKNEEKTPKSFFEALKQGRLVWAVFAVVLIGLSVFLWQWRNNENSSVLGVRRIAVLPFKLIGQDTRSESLKLGMTDALILRLSRVKSIEVMPTSFVSRFNKADQDPIAAGKELKVDAVLDGRIQETGNQMRISLQLVRIADGKIIWANEFSRDSADILELQTIMARAIAENLSLELSDEEQRALMKRYTNNTEAYRLYLEGAYFYNQRTAESRAAALRNFQKAVELDPSFALGYVALARTYTEPQSDISPKQAYQRMETLARQAIEIDDTLGEGYAVLGFAVWRGNWNWTEGEKYFQRATELNPEYQRAFTWHALLLTGEGKFDEALTVLSRSPAETTSANNGLGDFWAKLTINFYARKWDEAITEAGKISTFYPKDTSSMWLSSAAYRHRGDFAKAIELAEKHIATEEVTQPNALAGLGLALAAAGETAKAREIEKQLEAFSETTPNINGTRAYIFIALGKRERALDALDKAYEKGEYHLYLLKVNPDFDSLRNEPRFQEILRKINLAQ